MKSNPEIERAMTVKASEIRSTTAASSASARIARLSPQQQQLLLDRVQQKTRADQSQFAFPRIAVDKENLFQPFPLTESQEILWLGRSGVFELGACGTNLFMEIEFTDVPTEFPRLVESALNRLVRRHAMLRAIVLADGNQKVLPTVPDYEVEVEDLTALDQADVAGKLGQRREEMKSYNGGLDSWPLFQMVAFQLPSEVIRLMARFEATVIDGSGRILLFRELIELMKRPDGRLPEITLTYRDYALASRKFVSHPLYESSRAYWHRRLANLPPAPAIEYRRTPRDHVPRCVSRIIKLMELREWQLLKERAVARGITATALAARIFADALATETGAYSFTVGMIGSLHLPLHPEVDSIIGNFNTMSLLQVDGGGSTFATRARRLQDRLTKDLDNRYYSGFQVLRELRRQNPSPKVMLPVYFNSVLEYSSPTHKYWEIAGNNSSLPYRMVELNLVLPQVIVMFTVADTDGFLACKCQTLDEILPQGFAERIIENCKILLSSILRDQSSFIMDTAAQAIEDTAVYNNKPERCHLRNIAKSGQPAETALLHNPLECYIVSLWQEILNCPGIDMKSSFFELGGHSLELAVMLNQLERHLGRQLAIDQFWVNPTIECLCASISDERPGA